MSDIPITEKMILKRRIAELEQENESLRAECGLRQIQGYRECMERAAEIAHSYGAYDVTAAIRAEIDK